jgi:FADH2 O2-dependent halogenase
MTNQTHDVIIIGGGIAGTSMGAILSKHGYRTLVLERGKHPRFAIGESMLPQSSMWMWITGEQFGIPELQYLAHTERITEQITPSCGIKRSIAFSYHRPGQATDVSEVQQFIAPELPITSESHLFREDIDLYMWQVAEKYRAECLDKVTVKDVDITADRVCVTVEDGTIYKGKFLIDASGYRSPVATKYGLRDEIPQSRTNSRAIFTHVKGLPPYDEILNGNTSGFNYRLHDGTLHHVFDGGWMWIIPFDNHDGSNNDLASVGLMLDNEKYPVTDKSAGQEFWDIVRTFPSVAAHMENIEPVRDWVATNRLQFTASDAVEDRFMLLSHAHSFIDPLYSRGLISTFETIHAAANILLDVLTDGDFRATRFEYLAVLQDRLMRSTDQMVSNAYRAMRNFDLWNAWTQLWIVTKLFGDLWLFRHCLNYINSGDKNVLKSLHQYGKSSYEGAPFAGTIRGLVNHAEQQLNRVDAGEIEQSEAAHRILQSMQTCELLPKHIYNWGDSKTTHGDFNAKVPELIMWGKTAAPDHIRRQLFDFEMPAPHQ